jgi:uncharacterized protein
MASTILFSVHTDRWHLELRTRNTTPEEDLMILKNALGEGSVNPLARWTCEPPATWSFMNVSTPSAISETFHSPLVYENRQYLLRIRTAHGVTLHHATHPWSQEVDDSLDVDGDTCYATLRTGNDIGRFPLEITTMGVDGLTRTDRITWQVWPLKLDYETDLKSLSDAVEREYPLWLYRFLAPTDHAAGKAEHVKDKFLLMWLKQFEALRQDFERGVRTVIRSPHQRLDEHVRHLRADRIQGRLPRRLEENVAMGREHLDKRYRVVSRRSSFDTPENRFIKHAVNQVASRLERVETAINSMFAKWQDELGGVSLGFRSQLKKWQRTAHSYISAPMFRTVGNFEGLVQESLVLHNRVGYCAVYRAWPELRHYLEFFAKVRTTNIGMRQISELYELWCFLEIRRILQSLGFRDEATHRHPRLWKKSELETTLENGFGAAFQMRHDLAGIVVRLAHEPVFGSRGTERIHSYTVSQKPDIVLEASWVNTKRLLWVFDAKYRVKTQRDDRDERRTENQPLVPPDALDQMHRYRDALILRHVQDDEKSRPVVGAYALYPGVFNQKNQVNPYQNAIREVGIGAFPLLPRPGHDHWLREHLRDALGLRAAVHQDPNDPATLLVQENIRIPVTGLEYEHEDTLIVFLTRDRDPNYLQKFREGIATLYHTRVNRGPSRERLEQVRWLATIDPESRTLSGIYSVQSLDCVARGDLTWDQTGRPTPSPGSSDALELYHVLHLGAFHPRKTILSIPTNLEGGWYRYAHHRRVLVENDFRLLAWVRLTQDPPYSAP